MSVAVIYRDVEVGLRARLDAGMRARSAEVRDVHPELAATYARRVGRIAGGVAGVFLGCVLPLVAALMFAAKSNFEGAQLTVGLVAAVCVSVATYWAGRAWALTHAHELFTSFELSGNVHADIARLESEHPVAALAARTDRLETASIAWPLVAIVCLTPLSIHLVVAAAYGAAAKFDSWMGLSYLIVGHAHAFVAFCAVRLAKRLRRAEDLHWFEPRGWKAYGLTVAIAAVPGGVLIGLPPIITAVTGLFIPPLWGWAVRAVAAERRVLSV
jgi:hypothetical protein